MTSQRTADPGDGDISPTMVYATTFAGASLLFAIGGALTREADWIWYGQLAKPAWQPPGWVFGPVWFGLFVLIAIAAGKAWTSAMDEKKQRLMFMAFSVNGAFNVAWSYLFFSMKRPDFALFDIVALWLSIAALIALTFTVSRVASLLLVPYLAWVSLAMMLNIEAVRLNAPF